MPYQPLFGDATLAVHAGRGPVLDDPGTRAQPHPSSPEDYPDAAAVAALEERVAALEGGIGALATESAAAALQLAIATLTDGGGHIVATRSIGKDSRVLLEQSLARVGIETSWVDGNDLQAWQRAIRPETRLLFGASLAADDLAVLDIPRISDLAHAHRLPLLVDATLATPVLQKPLDLGADLVMHDASTYLGGHAVAAGGLLVDGGRFDWLASGRFAGLTQATAELGGKSYADESPIAAFFLRARRQGPGVVGAWLAPARASQLLRGLETLPLRMAAQVANAAMTARQLEAHPAVARAVYPGLQSHPQHALATRLLPAGAGAGVRLELRGGRAAGKAFAGALRLFSRDAARGDVRSHVAIVDRAPDETAPRAGARIRLSLGIESQADIAADLDRALAKVAQMLAA
jgi:O-acetylhomoserine (thiol)-lyase